MRTFAVTVLAASIVLAPASLAEQKPIPKPLNPERESPGLAVGEEAPDATLRNADGEDVSLADLYEKGPVVVTFYRGGWCPFCNRALMEWRESVSAMEEMGVTFAAISPETPEHAAETTEKDDLEYLVLSDVTGEAQRRFKVAFELSRDTKKRYRGYGIDLSSHNESGQWELPAPGTFIVDRDGIVRWSHATWDYREGRAAPSEVLAALREMQR
jgi:peroxiredoxin